MKIIHVSDIHLDSSLKTNLPPERAKVRKNEVINAFERLVQYASQNGVSAIIIAGDFFDTQKPLKSTRERVISTILKHPKINFYYVAGNHEKEAFLSAITEVPLNLKVFGDTWTYYQDNGVNFAGVAPTSGTISYEELSLPENEVNFVVLHGQTVNHFSKTEVAENVNLKKLEGKNIDYLALGHIHYHVLDKLDSRGVYAYSGCLEGRGYDECGVKGFVLIEVEGGKVTPTFVPFARRTIYNVELDLSSFTDWASVEDAVSVALSNASYDDMVRVYFYGKYQPSLRKNLDMLKVKLKDYFGFKIKDDSVMKLVKADLENDLSLRGEFMRQVYASGLTEEEIEGALLCGLKALDGEEL